jgi:hypothetical protein
MALADNYEVGLLGCSYARQSVEEADINSALAEIVHGLAAVPTFWRR